MLALFLMTISSIALAVERRFNFTVERQQVSIGAHMKYLALTYNGTVPGPVIQVKQGDKVSVHLENHTDEAHGIEIQGAQLAPIHFSGDPETPVNYTFTAAVPGVFDYHGSAVPILDNIASGMYGMMVVEPKGGWPNGKAQKITLIQSEFYGKPNSQGLIVGSHAQMMAADPDFIVFNGVVGHYGVSNIIPIKVGQLVRLFLLNAGPSLSSTFHVSGIIFNTVYKAGNPANVFHDLPSFEVAPGQGAVLEFTVTEPGDYRFDDDAGAHSYKGAQGVFRAAR
jgi:nitrite reductase (NO-forming)